MLDTILTVTPVHILSADLFEFVDNPACICVHFVARVFKRAAPESAVVADFNPCFISPVVPGRCLFRSSG